jgi:uncharacterized caspase-like protein
MGNASKALFVFLLVWAAPAWGEERFALLIGANAGWSDDKPLRYAETDAERMRDVLVELGGFSPDRVVLLRDPDTAEVRSRLHRLSTTLRSLGRDSLVVFYYSGHADAQHLHLRGAPLSHSELRKALESLPATVRVGVLDACRSGTIVTTKGSAPAVSFAVDVVDELRVRGLALLTSSGADEFSQEVRALAGSVFTHHLVSGLRGMGDEDGNGQVALSEAWRYAFLRTEADTAPTEAPHRPAFRFELEGQGEPILTRLGQATGRLLLPRGKGERYVVVDSHEVRLVAEARSRPEGGQALALAPGHYRVKRVGTSRLEVAEVLLTAGAPVDAGGLAYESRPLTTGLLKGRPETGDVEVLHAWRRGEALRLLAAGEAGAALSLFEELLTRFPEDEGALRGKARALVRLAESYDRLGDRPREYAALQEALRAEPSLAQDPHFARWQRRLEVLESLRREAWAIPEQAPPYSYRWGVGLELVGNRGMLAASVRTVLWEHWLAYASVDAVGPGVGLGVRYSDRWSSEWSPFYDVGVHASFRSLGLPSRGDFRLSVIGGDTSYQAVWGTTLHGAVGAHYVSEHGVSLELSLGLIGLHHAYSRAWGVVPMVGMGVGWYFRAPQ